MGGNDPRTDAELIEACNRGGPDEAARAFEALYRRHRDFVLRVARRFTRDADLALDALQETFTYLLRKFPPPGEGLLLTARLQTLLYPVAKNCAISALRKTRRFPSDPDVAADDLPAPVGLYEAEPIDAALAALPVERREVLTLRFVDGLSLAEIAAALDVPLGTVKSRLHLAIKQLRDDPRINDLFPS
ncbi:MAG TPA: sigma-70 family RNA polymerase sigma factor [Gammaproteobacteria bacterium]|nr:sigma-70 family RNA polymerase sigma factor [Gammaproteobacteria bacterium]